MSRRAKIIIAVIALLLVCGVIGIFVAFQASQSAGDIETVTARTGTLSVTVTVSGAVETDVSGDVFAPTAGTLAAVYVEDGEEVEAGDALALMDTAPMYAELAGAQAAYEQALASLDSIRKQVPSTTDKESALAAEQAALTAYEIAKDAYDKLVEADEILGEAEEDALESVPPRSVDTTALAFENPDVAAEILQLSQMTPAQRDAQIDQARLQMEQAYAQYLAAKAQREQLESADDVSAQRAAAEAQVSQAAEAVQLAQRNIDNAELIAPIDGTVAFPTGAGVAAAVAEPAPGASVSPAAPVMTIVQLGAVQFVGDVDEADVDSIDPGMGASVRLDAFPLEEFPSSVARVGQVSRTTVTGGNAFPVYVDLSGTSESILVGMQGSADIELEEIVDAVVVPIEALLEDDGEDVVVVVIDGVAETRVVEVGKFADTQVEILRGLGDGEEISVDGEVNASLIGGGSPFGG